MDSLKAGYNSYRQLQIKVKGLRAAGVIDSRVKVNIKRWKLQAILDRCSNQEVKVGDTVSYLTPNGKVLTGIVYGRSGSKARVTWLDSGSYFNFKRIEFAELKFVARGFVPAAA